MLQRPLTTGALCGISGRREVGRLPSDGMHGKRLPRVVWRGAVLILIICAVGRLLSPFPVECLL